MLFEAGAAVGAGFARIDALTVNQDQRVIGAKSANADVGAAITSAAPVTVTPAYSAGRR